jgi:inositol oxygenase
MAPAAISEVPNGKQMEELSDDIDSVNVLKAELKEKSFQEKSQFDSEKDKSIFRRYEEACDRVKNFYQEQHEKQTVAYNLKARNDFKLKFHAEMTIWEAMEQYGISRIRNAPQTPLSHKAQAEHSDR